MAPATHPAPPTRGPAGAKGHVPTPLPLELGQAPGSAFPCRTSSEPGEPQGLAWGEPGGFRYLLTGPRQSMPLYVLKGPTLTAVGPGQTCSIFPSGQTPGLLVEIERCPPDTGSDELNPKSLNIASGCGVGWGVLKLPEDLNLFIHSTVALLLECQDAVVALGHSGRPRKPCRAPGADRRQ